MHARSLGSFDFLGPCLVLVPESAEDELELTVELERHGVMNSMAFIKGGINGRLDLPARLQFDHEGQARVDVTVAEPVTPIDAWFRVVEIGDGKQPHRVVQWKARDEESEYMPWP